MRVLVAGGTGAIGAPLVERLVALDHQVQVLTRSQQRADVVRDKGAEAVVGDALVARTWDRVLADTGTEVVVNQLTSLPQGGGRRALTRGLAATGRLRTEASAALMAAAQRSGVGRVVAQSIAFAYRPGPGTRDEADPLYLDGPKTIASVAASVARLESETCGTDGVEGVVLRYGSFYGPGTYYAPSGAFAELARRRRLPLVGRGAGVFGFVHIDDAVSATVAALDGPAGIYNVVDDRPAPAAEWLPELARLLGAKAPRSVPVGLATLAAGRWATYLMVEQPAVSNERAGAVLGWHPDHPDWRQGFGAVFS